jgi:hypothetical protein
MRHVPRRPGRRASIWLAACVLWSVPTTAGAQATNLQVWGNLTFNWVKSQRLAYELDLEPKALVAATEDTADWRNIDVTPNVEFSPKGWYDIVVDTTVGRTLQTDDVTTTEVTPRLGVRFHLFSRKFHKFNERAPGRRLVVRNLLRVESRNFFYGGTASGSDSNVRVRNRLEFQVPLNHDSMSTDRTRYLLADWEWFMPLSDQEERFANRQRIRFGIGVRRSFQWRYEVLYIWTRSRNTIEDDFATSDNAINIRIKRIF